MSDDKASAPAASPALAMWWRAMGWRIGIVPVPLALLIAGIALAFTLLGEAPSDLPTSIAILGLGGFATAEIGRRIPGLRRLGLGAILATFLPSYMVYAHLLPAPLAKSISTFTDQSNFLYVFIASVIVGSILGMDRRIMVSGFLKIFAPLAAGSVAAFIVGCATGTALGLGFRHTLFKVVAPIMAGGVGEGAIPLSMGYAQITHGAQGDYFAEVLPAVMLGSLTAIVLAGALNFLGRRRPDLTGSGQIEPATDREAATTLQAHSPAPDVETVGAAALLIAALFLLGVLSQKLWGWPGPVIMLALAVAIKLARLAPPALERGAYANYRFFSVCATYPLLFAIGISKTPWEKLMGAFNAPTLITIAATVLTLVITGFFVGRWVGLHPIEAAIVTACHSGQGGTGDVAILTAAERLELMPFAQIATRIGGAITVTLILLAFARFGSGL
ncbi:2-hydroxycarboxylate transporter family protein [Phenylobacterium sp.]|jgi:CCS family citrate carrier protein|uniref:2-hydroxycarboxylate transporter family protein n=1 Tax=Phenylobacterium sp. TaxID=1871053 RepID=UPI002F403787